MFSKEDVSFPADGGIELSVWLFRPDKRDPLPAITMADGYAGTKYHGIEPFAEAGFAVLLHDHRGFGDGGGEPRQDVDPWQQVGDWRCAISYLQDRRRSTRTASGSRPRATPAGTRSCSARPTGA